jgi:hypothetical protein
LGIFRLELDGEQSARRQSIVLHGNGAPKRSITYECREGLARPAFWDGYVCAGIYYAMMHANKLIVDGPLSQRFLCNIRAFQEAWHCHRPDLYKVVEIEPAAAGPEAMPSFRPHGDTIVAFSGGIDSSFSLLRHASRTLHNGSHPISAAVIVHGFDVPCDDHRAFAALQMRAARIADAAGIRLSNVRTTIRQNEPENWEDYHAAALAGVLHLFAGQFSHGMIAATDSYDYISYLPYAWGSNPATDYLLSGAEMEIVHDGAGYTRPQKAAWLARTWPQVVPLLQFCWEGKLRDVNCGACNKCMQTRLSLLAAGFDDQICFVSKFDLGMLDRLTWSAKDVADLMVIVQLAKQRDCTEAWVGMIADRLAEHTSTSCRR